MQATLRISGRDRDQLILAYPPVKTGTGYAPPTILLEFGARATGEPNQLLPVACDMAPWLAGVDFPMARPLVMAAERTFWEKATAAHVYCLQRRLRGYHGLMAVNDLPPPELQETLAAMAGKSEAAFELFFKHYWQQIFPFVRSLVCDDYLAEEVVSDALLEVCRNPMAFDNRSRFSTYLCAIARHKAIDAIRKIGSTPERVDMEHPDVLMVADSQPWSDIEKQIDRSRVFAAFRQCLDKLPEKFREVAALSFVEECVETEVAKVLGCPIGTVKSRLSSVRSSLRKCLAPWYQGIKNA